jgi:8-oxo-dGTP pyrophosphatase MutT (NUDIX family)
VVATLQLSESEYVAFITPKDDQGAWKLLEGKCEPIFSIVPDGSLFVAVKSTKDTALEEFLEEAGADAVNIFWPLDETHLQLLDLYAKDWKDYLHEMECVADGNKVTWSKKAKDEIENYIKDRLSERI